MQEVQFICRGRKHTIFCAPTPGLKKYTGLMFRSSETDPLVFDFPRHSKPAIHSFFVFFTFLAVWLDDKNRVVSFDVVHPFNPLVRPDGAATRLIEIPFNPAHRRIIEIIVGKGKI